MKNSALKSALVSSAALVATSVGQVTEPAKLNGEGDKSFKAGMTLVNKAINGLKASIQSLTQLEPLMHEAATHAILHAQKYGDVTLAHKLVMSCRELPHPTAHQYASELVAYFRQNSPIRWDAKMNVRQAKENEPGYKPYDADKASAEPFFEMDNVKKSREAARIAGDRALEPLTMESAIKRAKGLLKTFRDAGKKDAKGQVRGYKSGEKTKILNLASEIEKVLPSEAPVEDDKD